MPRISAVLIALALVAGCGEGPSSPPRRRLRTHAASAASGADLTGAGATFPYPLYSKWFSDYATKTGVKINYQSIGSGGGIRQLSEQTVDFGASDAPMSDAELAKAKGGAILHVPTAHRRGGDHLQPPRGAAAAQAHRRRDRRRSIRGRSPGGTTRASPR